MTDYAKRELDLIGMTDGGNDYDTAMRDHILHMVEEFSKEGHSGFSASYAISCLEKLLRFEPLSPLTGADDEWIETSFGPEMSWQNKRCGRVFKGEDGRAYDIEGKVFWKWMIDEEGNSYKSHFTNRDSRVYVEFPYVPTHEYIGVKGAEG